MFLITATFQPYTALVFVFGIVCKKKQTIVHPCPFCIILQNITIHIEQAFFGRFMYTYV